MMLLKMKEIVSLPHFAPRLPDCHGVSVPLVAGFRGIWRDTVHYGNIAAVRHDGRPLAFAGDPQSFTFSRSTLKPFQALPLVREGGIARFSLSAQELAVICSSHNGEAAHLRQVRGLLRQAGARIRHLRCGCHPPAYLSATRQRVPSKASYSPVHHNCSGKHAGFLLYCRMRGIPLPEYLHPGSPLQRRIASCLRDYLPGVPLRRGPDGCGAPNYALPLAAIAYLYARLAGDDAGELVPLRRAMLLHPYLVSGKGRADLALSKAGKGDWIVKSGAGGLVAIGIRSQRIGLAIRVSDGSGEASVCAAIEALRQLGLLSARGLSALRPLARPSVVDQAGKRIGRLAPVFQLRRE